MIVQSIEDIVNQIDEEEEDFQEEELDFEPTEEELLIQHELLVNWINYYDELDED